MEAHIVERRQRVVELRQQGLTYRAIGARLGISHRTAQRDAHAAGVPVAAHRAPATGAELDARRTKIGHLASLGHTQTEIARLTGLSRVTVVRDLTALGVTARDGSRHSDATRTLVEDLLAAGVPRSHAARQAGVSIPTTYEWVPRQERVTPAAPVVDNCACGREPGHKPAPAFTSGTLRLPACDGYGGL